MKPTSLPLLQARHRRLAAQLARIGFISQGSAFQRKPGSAGSRYQWTWKDKSQKTKSLTLSKEQFQWLKRALANQRQLDQTLHQMRRISQRVLLHHLPGTKRRKSIGPQHFMH